VQKLQLRTKHSDLIQRGAGKYQEIIAAAWAVFGALGLFTLSIVDLP
jgi:hypothetical protein